MESKSKIVEEELWNALEMDSLCEEMTSASFAPNRQSVAGTGTTANACYMCDGSCTTSGCGGC